MRGPERRREERPSSGSCVCLSRTIAGDSDTHGEQQEHSNGPRYVAL